LGRSQSKLQRKR